MMRRYAFVVFLAVMLSSAVHLLAQSTYEPPPTPTRRTTTPIPAALGRVQRPQTLGFGDNGESGTYTYDGSGNITAIGSDTFLYDAEGRLKTAVIRAVTGSYTYDAFGNRKTATGETNCSGQTVCATPLTLDSTTNRLLTTTNGTTTTVGYDAAGNITSASGGSYTYDGTGMMTEATVGSDDRQFVYTAGDERIAVRQGQSWTWTVRGPDNKVLREFTSTEPNSLPGFPDADGTWIKDYIWRDGLLLASVATSTSGNVTWHYHLDHLGTPRLITNASGVKVAEHAYYPFGAEISLTPHESSEEAMKFTGHERDGVAGDGHTLDDMHARYYNASLGRFLSVDPILGKFGQPQTSNRYSYVANNPVNLLDADGRAIALAIYDASAFEGMWTSFGSPDPDGGGGGAGQQANAPPGGPPVPVPDNPSSDWKFNADPQNPRGGSYGPTKPQKGRGGGQPSASWEGGAAVPHWDVDDGKGNRRRYDQKGNFITPEKAHGLPTPRSTILTPGEVLGAIGLAIFGTAITFMTGGGALLQPSPAGVAIVPRPFDFRSVNHECLYCT
jgi:RHS repeat-associated protein